MVSKPSQIRFKMLGKTCAEPKKDLSHVSAPRPQPERQVVNYVDGADDETTSQRAAGIPNDYGIGAVKSLSDLCLAFPPTISMDNMPSELQRNQPNAETMLRGTGIMRRALKRP